MVLDDNEALGSYGHGSSWMSVQGWHVIVMMVYKSFIDVLVKEKLIGKGEQARFVRGPHKGLEVNREAMIYTNG